MNSTDTIEALRVAIEALEIGCDWGFTEVEIDGEIETVYDILDMLRTTRNEAIENMEGAQVPKGAANVIRVLLASNQNIAWEKDALHSFTDWLDSLPEAKHE